MISLKRMTDRFGARSREEHLADINLDAKSVPDVPPIPPFPYDHRASISTQTTSSSGERTSSGSEWSKRGDSLSLDIIDERPLPALPIPSVLPVVPRVVSRPKGCYKLADFIIHRTLGTGSFGRVHLGTFISVLIAISH